VVAAVGALVSDYPRAAEYAPGSIL
jgi:hypothetical protein